MQHQTSPGQGRPPRRRVSPRSAVAASGRASGAPAELRAVIDALPEAVLVCDRDDRVRIVNPAADRLFRGRPVQDVPDLLSRFEALPAEPGSDQPTGLRPRHLPSRWFELRSFPIDRGDAPVGERAADRGRILVLRDVTTSREERAERHAFMSILSHELRTPITTIYAGSRVLARREGAVPHGSREIAADISAEAARLYDVVEDLLVLTRAEQGILELSDEPIHLRRVLEAAVRLAANRSPGVPVVLAGVADPPAVRGDAGYAEHIVRNLVTAATRHGGPGAPVIVRLEAVGPEVLVSVLDRGADPSDEDLAATWDLPDEQAGPRRGGGGIGLFVCRRLAEAMKGRTWVRRRNGGGAEHGVALPRYDALD